MSDIDIKMNEAVGELRAATKQLEEKGTHVAEIKEKLEKVNVVLDEQEVENQKIMKSIAAAESANEKLIESEKRIVELETKMAKMSDSYTGGDSNVKMAAEIEDLKRFCASGREAVVDSQKYLRSDSNVDGGFTMAESTDSMIYKPLVDISDIRPFANVKQRSTLNNHFVIEETPVVSNWNGENITPTESNPTYGKRSITLHDINTRAYITLRAMMGSQWNLESELLQSQVKSKAVKEGAAFVNGTGNGQPYGMISRLVADSRLYASGDAALLPLAAILKVPGEIKAAYKTAMYAFNNRTLHAFRALTESAGTLAWQPGNIAAGIPNQINGHGYTVLADMDDIGADKFPVFFGSIKECYTICDGMEVVFQRVFNAKGGYDILMFSWVGADVVMPEAGIVIKCATSV